MLVSERLRICSEIKILSEVDEVALSGNANSVNSGLTITAGNAKCGGVSERWHYWLQKSHWLKTPIPGSAFGTPCTIPVTLPIRLLNCCMRSFRL